MQIAQMAMLIIGAVAVGCYLLALVSAGFAYELSRGVEAVFDFVEYKAALRAAHRHEREERGAQLARVSAYNMGN